MMSDVILKKSLGFHIKLLKEENQHISNSRP